MNPAGDTVIFERTPTPDDGSPTTLQMMDDHQSQPCAVPVGLGAGLTDAARLVLGDRQSQRPVQRRQRNNSNKSPVSVMRLAGSDGAEPDADPRHDGCLLSEVEPRGHSCSSPRMTVGTPVSLQLDLHPRRRRRADRQHRRRSMRASMPMFGGMPAVMSTDLPQIAYAGAAEARRTGTAPTRPIGYSENNNYIFLNTAPRAQLHRAPLEWDASVIVLRSAAPRAAPLTFHPTAR